MTEFPDKIEYNNKQDHESTKYIVFVKKFGVVKQGFPLISQTLDFAKNEASQYEILKGEEYEIYEIEQVYKATKV